MIKRLNWQIWAGFLLSLFVFVSYPLIFANWPITRDLPWVNLLLLVVAVVLLFFGIRRSFGHERGWFSKGIGVVVLSLSALVLAGFIFTTFVMPTWLPESKGAPEVGRKAPEFTFTDQNGKSVSLSSLLTEPFGSSKPKSVLLIFYRGYW
jgi:membrane protease YdiL (CAAX protease family)